VNISTSTTEGKVIVVSGTIKSETETSPITVHLIEEEVDGEIKLRVVFFSLNAEDVPVSE
jgi:ABC-type sulfate transport system permease subunit